jgi:hypothetical protein
MKNISTHDNAQDTQIITKSLEEELRGNQLWAMKKSKKGNDVVRKEKRRQKN